MYTASTIWRGKASRSPTEEGKGQGIDHLALKIKEIARESQIQIVENKPLARALYKDGEIGKVIPESLFKAIAEVLAYVYRANGAR